MHASALNLMGTEVSVWDRTSTIDATGQAGGVACERARVHVVNGEISHHVYHHIPYPTSTIISCVYVRVLSCTNEIDLTR